MRTERMAFQGARQIAQFNRRFYAAALLVCALGLLLLWRVALPSWLGLAVGVAIAATAFWAAASLAVAHYVYDRSPLYQFGWLSQMLAEPPRRWVNLHAGLDESSAALRRLFPTADGRVLDIYDPQVMPEPAIKRARELTAEVAAPAGFRALPLADGSCDAAFVIFCAHELRAAEARCAFFGELRRVLGERGSIVLVEHLRDWPNFMAFGPGCFHFYSRREWTAAARAAGLAVAAERRLTPFVRAFRLERQ